MNNLNTITKPSISIAAMLTAGLNTDFSINSEPSSVVTLSPVKVDSIPGSRGNTDYRDSTGNPIKQETLMADYGLTKYFIRKAFRDTNWDFTKAHAKLVVMSSNKTNPLENNIGKEPGNNNYKYPNGVSCGAKDLATYYGTTRMSICHMFRRHPTTGHDRLNRKYITSRVEL